MWLDESKRSALENNVQSSRKTQAETLMGFEELKSEGKRGALDLDGPVRADVEEEL